MTAIAFVVAATLLSISAALRAAGASLVRTPRADALRDNAEGNERAGIVAELLEDRARIQPSLSMVHSALLVAAAVPAAWAVTQLYSGWGLVVALVILGVALVALGDLLPRSVGRSQPRRLAYRFARLLRRSVGLGQAAADLLADEDEIDALEETTDDDRHERELISSVIEFSDTLVREVMVPRPDMLSIAPGATTDDALDLFVEHGFSRIPVNQNGDDVQGIVYAKDLLGLMDERSGPRPVTAIMRDVYFVPETKLVAELLRNMQASQVHMAVVVDEFGAIAGLVTIEDLLEELVGEIVDEYDTKEAYVADHPDGGLLVDARLPVDDLSELLGVELPDDEWDTVGGLVLQLAGRVPREGERFELDGVILVTQRVQGRRVAQVRAIFASGE